MVLNIKRKDESIMKYIRMKNGEIIAFLDEDRETKLPNRDLRFYFIKPDKVIAFIGKDEIIKQADTIEELCDEFVLLNHKETGKPFLDKDLEFLKNASKLGYDVRGAIWTDNGLIYRAKMKGILPNGEIDWELL